MKKAFKFNVFTFAVLCIAILQCVFLAKFCWASGGSPFGCGNLPRCVLSAFAVKNVSAEDDLFEKVRVIKPKTVKPAPLFTLKSLEGKEISLEDFNGKVVLLNFWATWCVPCREEMPAMQKLYNIFTEKGFVVLAVSIDRENKKGVKSFVEELNLTFPVLLDPDQKVRKKYFISGLPTSYLIDAEGKLKGFISGAREWDSDVAIKLIDAFLQGND